MTPMKTYKFENKIGGDIFYLGLNPCQSNGVKLSYFCHSFYSRQKKFVGWVGGGLSKNLVNPNLCLTILITATGVGEASSNICFKMYIF